MGLKEKIFEYRYAILISFLSGIVALFKDMALFFPIVMGFYIVYRFRKQAKDLYVATIFYPFLLLVTCFTSGFGFLIMLFIKEVLKIHTYNDANIVWIFLGISGAITALLVTKLLFKIKLKKDYFLFLILFIPIPYLIVLPFNELSNLSNSSTFYFLFNLILLITIETALNKSREQKKFSNTIK